MKYMQYAACVTGREWAAQWTEDRSDAEERVREANALRPHEFSRLIERRIIVEEWHETA